MKDSIKKHWVLYLGLFLSAGFFIFPALNWYFVTHHFIPKADFNSARVIELKERILQDLKLVSTQPPFEPATDQKNAESLLTQHVSWEGGDLAALSTPSHTAMKSLFEKYASWKTNPALLKEMSRDLLLKQIDTSWMSELAQYDHWNFSINEVIQKRLTGAEVASGIAKIGIFSTLPLPRFNELREWGIVRFLQDANAGKAIEGLKIFRKAANLNHSAGILVSEMVAISMLLDEKVLTQAFNVPNWPFVPNESIQAYKRLSWASVALVRMPWFQRGIPAEFEALLKPETGLCAGVWESVVGLEGFRDYLEPHFPMEIDFATNLERARTSQRKVLGLCRMNSYAKLIEPAKTSTESSHLNQRELSAKFPELTSIHWTRIPYLRQSVGLAILSISSPNWFRLYDPQKI